MAAPSAADTWIVGTLWKSASSVPAVEIREHHGAAARHGDGETLVDARVDPRSQTTILPATFAGSSVPEKHRATSLSGVAGLSPFGRPTAVDRTIGSAGVAAAVEAPV